MVSSDGSTTNACVLLPLVATLLLALSPFEVLHAAPSYEARLANLAARTIERATAVRARRRPLLPFPRAPVSRTTDASSLRVAEDDLTYLRVLSSARAPRSLVVGCRGVTRDEVQAFLDILAAINRGMQPALRLHILVKDAVTLHGLAVDGQYAEPFIDVSRFARVKSLWLQDCGELAAAPLRGEDGEGLVVVDTRRADLEGLPALLAATWSARVVVPQGLQNDVRGNFGGNIEATPDGLLVLGSTCTTALHQFFLRHGYFGRTLLLDTGWLDVGHVDELVSFLPLPSTPLDYVIVRADPALGTRLLEGIPPCTFVDELVDVVRTALAAYARFPEGYGDDDFALLQDLVVDLGLLYRARQARRRSWETVVEENVDRLERAIVAHRGDPAPIQVVSLPTLFVPGEHGARSLLPNMVNMVVLGDHVILPDPFLPTFRRYAARVVKGLGFTPHFLASTTYHLQRGQVHCGTLVIRHPESARVPLR